MLYLVSTPIGNLEDLTLRAIRILQEANVIVCEDTRETVKLLKHLNIPPKPLISLYEENETSKIEDVLALVQNDQSVALVSDSGTPLVSDPGYKLVREAVKRNLPVQAVPGPSAVLAALVVSGLPPDKFLFLGFLPEKEGHRLALLNNLKVSLTYIDQTVVIYMSPHKLTKQLDTLSAVFGDIEIVLVREMTKIYEESWHGPISLAQKKYTNPRGEFVLLFSLKAQSVDTKL